MFYHHLCQLSLNNLFSETRRPFILQQIFWKTSCLKLPRINRPTPLALLILSQPCCTICLDAFRYIMYLNKIIIFLSKSNLHFLCDSVKSSAEVTEISPARNNLKSSSSNLTYLFILTSTKNASVNFDTSYCQD